MRGSKCQSSLFKLPCFLPVPGKLETWRDLEIQFGFFLLPQFLLLPPPHTPIRFQFFSVSAFSSRPPAVAVDSGMSIF
jgi:hypothetical protein